MLFLLDHYSRIIGSRMHTKQIQFIRQFFLSDSLPNCEINPHISLNCGDNDVCVEAGIEIIAPLICMCPIAPLLTCFIARLSTSFYILQSQDLIKFHRYDPIILVNMLSPTLDFCFATQIKQLELILYLPMK